MISFIASNEWLNSIDVKTAFLQRKKIDRTVLIKPPQEVETSKLWRLKKKYAYGLVDAPRYWYLRLRTNY